MALNGFKKKTNKYGYPTDKYGLGLNYGLDDVSYDPFQPVTPEDEQPPKGYGSDFLTSIKKGALQIPATLTGIADIPAGLMGYDRPFDKATDYLGGLTGFTPERWAQDESDYSPEMQQASQNVNAAWNDPATDWRDVAQAYIQNPRAIGKTVAESIPSMLAGGGIGGLFGRAALKGLGAAAAIPSAAVGEGAIMAGQAMNTIDPSVSPQKSAVASLGIGALGGLIGAKSGAIANKLGFGDIDTILASGGRQGFGNSATGYGKRVIGGAIQEGPVEEGLQSVVETGLQNYAENKPITQGMARNFVEGSLAGTAMGGGINALNFKPKSPLSNALTSAGIATENPVVNEAENFQSENNQKVGDNQSVNVVFRNIEPTDDERLWANNVSDKEINDAHDFALNAVTNPDIPTQEKQYYADKVSSLNKLIIERQNSYDEDNLSNDSNIIDIYPESIQNENQTVSENNGIESKDENSSVSKSLLDQANGVRPYLDESASSAINQDNQKAFTPTHELATGELVIPVDDENNVWIDANGDEYIDDSATPLPPQPQELTNEIQEKPNAVENQPRQEERLLNDTGAPDAIESAPVLSQQELDQIPKNVKAYIDTKYSDTPAEDAKWYQKGKGKQLQKAYDGFIEKADKNKIKLIERYEEGVKNAKTQQSSNDQAETVPTEPAGTQAVAQATDQPDITQDLNAGQPTNTIDANATVIPNDTTANPLPDHNASIAANGSDRVEAAGQDTARDRGIAEPSLDSAGSAAPGQENQSETNQSIGNDVTYDDIPGIIKRSDGAAFPTEAKAKTALRNRKIDASTHDIVPISDGFAIAPVKSLSFDQFKALPRNSQFSDEVLVQSYKAETGNDAPVLTMNNTTNNDELTNVSNQPTESGISTAQPTSSDTAGNNSTAAIQPNSVQTDSGAGQGVTQDSKPNPPNINDPKYKNNNGDINLDAYDEDENKYYEFINGKQSGISSTNSLRISKIKNKIVDLNKKVEKINKQSLLPPAIKIERKEKITKEIDSLSNELESILDSQNDKQTTEFSEPTTPNTVTTNDPQSENQAVPLDIGTNPSGNEETLGTGQESAAVSNKEKASQIEAPKKWRDSLVFARQYARRLGVDYNEKDLSEIVSDIDNYLATGELRTNINQEDLPNTKDAKSFVIDHITKNSFDDYNAARESVSKAFKDQYNIEPTKVFGNNGFFRSDDFTNAVHEGLYENIKSRGASLPVPINETDVNRENFRRAFHGTSFRPEERGDSQVRSYVKDMVSTYESLSKLAKTPDQQQILNDNFADYKDRYISKLNAYMSAHGNVMSSMITGPANFPTRRNEKKNATTNKRLNELVEYHNKAVAGMKKAILDSGKPEQSPLEEAQSRLASLEKYHQLMKDVNKVVKNKKLPNEEKVSKIQELGLTDKQIHEILKPDFAGRVGFADYQLINNLNTIKRLKDRVAELSSKETAKQEQLDGNREEIYHFEGGRVEVNRIDDRVRIFHEEKPSKEVIANLKRLAFKWSPTNQAWQRQATPQGIKAAIDFTGAKANAVNLNQTRPENVTPKFLFSKGAKTTGKIDNPAHLVDIALSRNDGNKAFSELGNVSKEVVEKIKQTIGIDVSGWQHSIDEASIRHVFDSHGNSETESKLGQIAITRDDIGRLLDVVNSPDNIDKGNEPNTIELSKRIGNEVFVVQEIKTGRNKLALKTMWKKPLSARDAPLKASPAETSVTFGKQAFPYNVSIAQPHTKASLIQALTQTMDGLYGKGWTGRLFKTGKFKAVSRDEAGKFIGKEAQAFYNPADQTTYFIHDAITTSDDLHGLALHEIGIHALQLGKTDEAFQSILNQVEQLKATSSKVKEAFEQVPEDTHPDNVIEEALAYLVQKHPNLPIVRKFLAWLRNAIRNISPNLSQWASALNMDDLVYMAQAALKSAPQSLAKQWQIKSATGNTGAFSAKNNDIRYAKKQYPTSVTELEEIIQGSTLTTTPTTWQNIKDKTVEYLTDSTRPFDVWTRALPDKIATARLIAAKDLAKGKKQAFEKEAMLRFGNAISKDIFELANHMQVDFDYAKEMAGQWLTMRYARVANNRLLNRYKSLADEAAQALDDFENNPDPNLTPEEFETERNKLKAASIRADKQVVKFVEAMNNDAIVDPTENSHAIGLAGGYNNKTAIHLRQAIEARVKNLPALHKIANNVYQMNAWKLEQDIKNGKVTQEAADKFDDSGWYVPLTGDPRNDDSVDDIFSVGNVNQQKDHRLEGRTSSIAQNGIDASFEQLEKSARYHGWNDFKTQLNSIYQTLLDDKIADGASHSEASKAINQDYGLRRQPLRPGIMPRETDIIYRKDGKTAIFTIHNQAATDALRGKNTEDVPLIARIAQPITAWNARFVTQFQPTFAAINATRDILERSEHIRTREIPGYEQVDMNAVGNRALTIAFNPKTFRDLLPLIGQDVTGLRNIQNGASELFNEFINAGGVATWSSYLSSNREEFSKNLEKQNSRLGKGLNYIGTYNNAFDIVPGFAIFKALREQGIDSNAAAATTLNLMNFHKQGKAMPLVRAAYMFAQPIAHGGHQLTITLSTQRGQMRFLAMMTAGILLYSVLRAGDDDDELGVNKYDQISNYVMERNIPIKIPGSDNRYFKMPIGFGPHQIAWGIAANLVKRANGYQTAGDTLVDISKIWVKTFAPVSPSDIPIKEHFSTWAMQTFTPSVFKGLANVAMDVNSFGNPLTTPFKNKGYAKALQGKRNTPNEYKLFAQELAKFGFDLYPEQIRELTRNYLPNFLYPVIQAGIENPALEARGKPTIEPYASRFILQTDQERTKEQIFYRHLDKLAKASSEASLGGALTDKQKAQVQLFNRVEKLQHKMNGNMAAATKAEKAHQTGKAKLYKSRSDQIYEKMLDVVMADFRGE